MNTKKISPWFFGPLVPWFLRGYNETRQLDEMARDGTMEFAKRYTATVSYKFLVGEFRLNVSSIRSAQPFRPTVSSNRNPI